MSHERDVPSWARRPPIVPALLQEDPLILDIAAGEQLTNRDWQRLLDNLLARCGGMRDWAQAAEDYVSRAEYARAARCIEKLEPAHSMRADILDHLQDEWRAACEHWRSATGVMEQSARELAQAGCDVALALELLGQAASELRALPGADDAGSLVEALSRLAPGTASRIEEYLELAQMQLAEAREQQARRAAEIVRRLLEGKREADEYLNQVLLSDLHEEDRLVVAAERLRPVLDRAFRARELDRFEHLVALARRLQGRDYSACDEVDAMGRAAVAPPGTPVASPRTLTRAPMASASVVSWSALSPLAQRELEELIRDKGQQDEAGDASRLEPLVERTWHQADIASMKAEAASLIGATADLGRDRLARLHFLQADAKLRLLDGDAELSRVLFTDAFRWISGIPGELGEHEPAWRELCARGLLLSIAIPYLTEDERRAVLEPMNLDALFLRPEQRLCVRLEQMGLFPDLALTLLDMEPAAARVFFRDYLAPYCSRHPVPTEHFLIALLRGGHTRFGRVLTLFADVLDALGVPFASEARGFVDGFVEPSGELSTSDPRIVKERLAALRTWLLGRPEWTDFAESVDQRLQEVEQSLGRSEPEAPPVLNLRLLTPEIELGRSDRLVVEVHYLRGSRPILGIRTAVVLHLPNGERAPAVLGVPSRLPAMFPGDRKEVLVHLRQDVRATPGQGRLVVQPSEFRPEGLWRVFKPSSLTLALAPPARPRTPPPNPYLVGVAVEKREAIFGREDQVTEITRALVGERQDNAVLVHGERRIGKTTLLNAVIQEPLIRERYQCLRVDLQDIQLRETAEIFYRDRLVEPVQRLLAEKKIPVPDIPVQLLRENPAQGFRRFMVEVDHRCGQQRTRLLVILDELERLIEVIEAHPEPEDKLLGMDVMATLRAAILELKHVSFILCGVSHAVLRHTERPENRLFKLAIPVKLRPLESEDVERLVRDRVRGIYAISPAATDLIVRETGRQPYLVQYVCHELFRHMMSRQPATVATVIDVEKMLQEFVQQSRGFSYLLDYLADPQDLAIAKALAWRQRGNLYVPIDALQRHLRQEGLELDLEQLRQRLSELARQAESVFERKVASTNEFRLSIGAFAAHLRHLLAEDARLIVRSPN